MRKHGIRAFSRRLLHQLFAIVSIHAEGKCRQGIRNQVYPQNMTRLQRRRKAGQNRCKHCDNFPEIRGQEKQDRFADILINPTSLADCLLNCGKIIIRQNQVCGIPSYIRSALSHRHTDICRAQRRGIVDPVSGHGYRFALCFESMYDADLVLRGHSRKNPDSFHTSNQLFL